MFSYHLTPYNGNEFAYGKNSPPWRYHDKDSLTDLSKCMTWRPWSPIKWKDGRRCKDNFLVAYYMGLDFDEGLSLMEAKDIFQDSIHIIGTTKSHQKEKGGVVADRFRVVLRFDEPIYDADLFKYQIERAVKLYGCDNAAKDAGRPFWPCKEIISINPDGYTQEIHEKPQPNPIWERVNRINREKKKLPNYCWQTFNLSWPMGKRNDRLNHSFYFMFNVGFTKEEAMELFLNSPMFKENRETGFLEQTKSTMESAWEGSLRTRGLNER